METDTNFRWKEMDYPMIDAKRSHMGREEKS